MPSPVPFRKVRKLLEDAGWKLVKINGSHHKFKHDDVREHITIPVHKNLVRYGYVRDIEKTIAEQAKKTKAELSKPIASKFWNKAAKLAESYTVIIALEEDYDGPTYFGRTLEMPLVMADGKTRSECMDQVLEATTFTIATILEDGERPPAPASDEKRSAQVNVRLTADEKFRIEEAARRAGFRGVSDFVRAAALDKAG